MKHNQFFALTLLSLFCLGLVGCSDADARFARVEGTVTYNGNPVVGASVRFQSVDSDGESAVGTTDANGRFTLTSITAADGGRGALPGQYRVVITLLEPAPPCRHEAAYQAGEIDYSTFQQRLEASRGEVTPPRRSLIPERYSRGSTSTLEATVVQGRNAPFNFDLTGQ